MSATNHTTNYELPIFIGTDKPAWLVDWNGAMTAIDTALHQVEGKADQAGTDIGGIESSISTINSTLTSINNAVSQLRIDTNANTGNINTINSLIGNGEPTTTDKTLIGAINELDAFHNLTTTGTATITTATGYSLSSDDRSLVKYAINSDKTLGKIYGTLQANVTAESVTFNNGWNTIATIASSDFKTLAEAFNIEIGTCIWEKGDRSQAIAYPARLRFNTDKTISVQAYRGAGSTTYATTDAFVFNLVPCLYILKDLGD